MPYGDSATAISKAHLSQAGYIVDKAIRFHGTENVGRMRMTASRDWRQITETAAPRLIIEGASGASTSPPT